MGKRGPGEPELGRSRKQATRISQRGLLGVGCTNNVEGELAGDRGLRRHRIAAAVRLDGDGLGSGPIGRPPCNGSIEENNLRSRHPSICTDETICFYTNPEIRGSSGATLPPGDTPAAHPHKPQPDDVVMHNARLFRPGKLQRPLDP